MSRKTYVGDSKIRGKGVFASRDLERGEIAFIAKGKLKKFVIHSKKDALFGPNWMSIVKDVWLDPKNDNPLNFINHSCNPNLGIKGKITFVPLRDIKKDEELTIDYSIIELDSLWEMDCRCGSKECRKVIRSIKFLPNKNYKRYYPFIPRYLAKVYSKEHNLGN